MSEVLLGALIGAVFGFGLALLFARGNSSEGFEWPDVQPPKPVPVHDQPRAVTRLTQRERTVIL